MSPRPVGRLRPLRGEDRQPVALADLDPPARRQRLGVAVAVHHHDPPEPRRLPGLEGVPGVDRLAERRHHGVGHGCVGGADADLEVDRRRLRRVGVTSRIRPGADVAAEGVVPRHRDPVDGTGRRHGDATEHRVEAHLLAGRERPVAQVADEEEVERHARQLGRRRVLDPHDHRGIVGVEPLGALALRRRAARRSSSSSCSGRRRSGPGTFASSARWSIDVSTTIGPAIARSAPRGSTSQRPSGGWATATAVARSSGYDGTGQTNSPMLGGCASRTRRPSSARRRCAGWCRTGRADELHRVARRERRRWPRRLQAQWFTCCVVDSVSKNSTARALKPVTHPGEVLEHRRRSLAAPEPQSCRPPGPG